MPLAGNISKPRPARYRAVHWAAVASVVLGALALLLAFHGAFLALPLAAFACGWWALRRIAQVPEEFTGVPLAWTGIALAAVFGLAGCVCLLWVRAREVPYGYQRLEYIDLQPDPADPKQKIPESVLKLDRDGTKIFIKGFMIAGRQQIRLKTFWICPTNADCTFCPIRATRTEIIRVDLTGDLTTDYTREPIALGGRLHVDLDEPHGRPYSMQADYLRR